MESSMRDLAGYRYNCSVEALEDAKIMYENGRYKKETSKIIKKVYESRERADYLDFYVASKEEAKEQIERAEKLQSWIRKYLEKMDVL